MVKPLKEIVKSDIESVNLEMARTAQKYTKVLIFSGLSPDDITAATKKMDFKETKEKICGRPLYCTALRNLTPTKENAEAKENEKNEGEKEHINKENDAKPAGNPQTQDQK